MRCSLLLPTLILASILFVPAHAGVLLKPGDHLAICGDATGGDTGYTTYIEDYLLGCEQVPNVLSKQFGWGAQSPQDFVKVLPTDLLPFKPTVVTLLYGFGDNGTTTPDPNALAARRQGEIDLIEALKKAGVRTILLGSPIAVDGREYHKDPAKAAAYNQALAAIAASDKETAAKEGIIYADVYGLTLDAMTKLQAAGITQKDRPFYVGDPWSLNDLAKLTVAQAFLKGLGCSGDIAQLTLDFKTGHADSTPGTKILSYAAPDYTLNVETTKRPLSFPCYPSGQPAPDPGLNVISFNNELNRFVLTVKNLPSPKAKVYWGGDVSHDYSADELAKGVNLQATMFSPTAGSMQDLNGDMFDHETKTRVAATAVKDATTPKVDAQPDEGFTKAIAASQKPSAYTIRIVPLADYELHPPQPVNIIFDTDMNGDVDDVGAAALLGSFAAQGEAKLLAGGIDTHDNDKSSGAVLHAVWKYYGFPDVPIGSFHADDGSHLGSAYTKKIHQQFDPEFPDDDKLPEASDLYRKTLAAAADGSVTLVAVGPLENFWALYNSKPDATSPLAGPELIKQKVRKFVIMANTMKGDGPYLMKWPTPILWTIEVGSYISAGRGQQSQPDTDPAKIAYKYNGEPGHNCLQDGRQAWDPSAAWLAVRGPGDLFDVTWGGYWLVDDKGSYGPWVNGPPANQNRVVMKMPFEQVGKMFDAELARLPKGP